jgi:hypothetical protein
MAPLISTAILIVTTLASFSIAFALARLGLAAMFRLLPASRPPVVSEAEPLVLSKAEPPLRVISGGRSQTFVGAVGATGRSPA